MDKMKMKMKMKMKKANFEEIVKACEEFKKLNESEKIERSITINNDDPIGELLKDKNDIYKYNTLVENYLNREVNLPLNYPHSKESYYKDIETLIYEVQKELRKEDDYTEDEIKEITKTEVNKLLDVVDEFAKTLSNKLTESKEQQIKFSDEATLKSQFVWEEEKEEKAKANINAVSKEEYDDLANMYLELSIKYNKLRREYEVLKK